LLVGFNVFVYFYLLTPVHHPCRSKQWVSLMSYTQEEEEEEEEKEKEEDGRHA
jgi:hypothetical protein